MIRIRRAAPPLRRFSAALALALVAGACDPSAAEARWPRGTVLVADGEPLAEADVDALAEPFAELAPAHTLPHRRRVALTEILIPRAFARSEYGAGIPDARSRVEARIAAIESGEEPSPPEVEGGWARLGKLTWVALRETDVGDWTEPFEGPGFIARVRLVARDGNRDPALERFRIRPVYEYYAPTDFSIAPEDLDGTLEIVADDPETWRAVLPLRWLHALEGTRE